MAQVKTRIKAKRSPSKNEESDSKDIRRDPPPEESVSHAEGEPPAKKIGKMHESIEDHEDDLGLDAKIDDETPSAGEEEEASGEEIALDDEELNPFGDKWEL